MNTSTEDKYRNRVEETDSKKVVIKHMKYEKCNTRRRGLNRNRTIWTVVLSNAQGRDVLLVLDSW